MKKILSSIILVIILVSFTGCVNTKTTTNSNQSTAEEIASKLKSTGIPIGSVIVYNENTDKNKLLGRPNQYISKVNFSDTTLNQVFDSSNPVGGSIETFNNSTDLNSRKNYIESIGKQAPIFAEYLIVNGNYLLRLDKGLTTTQVDKYKEEFIKIK